MKKEYVKVIKIGGWLLFIIYLIALVYFMFFSERYGRTISERHYSYNLALFREIKRFIIYRERLGLVAVMTNLVGNVAAFIPFGFIVPIIRKKKTSLFTVVLMTFELSLTVEVIQLFLKVGCFDVDDLLLNTIGGLVGFILFWIMNKIRRKFYG